MLVDYWLNDDKTFQINSIKKSGKKSMSAKEFLNGHNLNVGEVID